jgi:hypothetical protein
MNRLLRLAYIPVLICSLSACGVIGAPGRILSSTVNAMKAASAKKKEAALLAASKDAPKETEANATKETTGLKETKETVSTVVVGEVSYVDAESGFILIRQTVGQRVAPSTALISKGTDGSITSKLMSSSATKGSFVAADILSGSPERGNAVLADPDTKTKGQGTAKPIGTQGDPAAGSPNDSWQAPKLEPILPPLNDLRPPSGDVEAPPLPTLPQ